MPQLQGEILKFMEMLDRIYKTLGMPNYKILLATRPEKRMGSDEHWDLSEGALAGALKELGLPFEYAPGEGAFYGPKLEMHFVDAIGRSWQTGTIQVDPNLPEAFDLKYTGEDNQDHRPLMLHRAVLGSLERFISVYLEHTGGHLPTWLCPTQVVIMNITDRVNDFCGDILQQLKSEKVRVHFDNRNEQLKFKIREGQLQKVPFMIIVGDREAEQKTVSLRLRDGSEHKGLTVDQVKNIILTNIKERHFTVSINQ
jgi:threonyl-tRNA synthetase